MPNSLLSIIIPAYNEEKRLPETLSKIQRFLAGQTYSYEVLVVENGSNDRTLEIARQFAAEQPRFHALHLDGRGKGLAVQAGMLATHGEYRFICDADLSMPIEEVNRFIPPLKPEGEIIIGSREAPGAVRYNEPAYRHLSGRAFNWVVRQMALPGLRDTQCGFKCFKGCVAERIFPLQTIHGWTFDVEVLYIARRMGYRIVEMPVPWYFNTESKVHLLRDLRQVIRDLLIIRRNARRGVYDVSTAPS
ncbi:MAG: dolichyl-phosphate beta-glucosyltransferase [Chloroflexota bacterium]